MDNDNQLENRKQAVIPEDASGARLDRILGTLFPDHSRSFLARLIDEGHVRVDGQPAGKSSQRVDAGQVVDVLFPPPAPTAIHPQDIKLKVLYDDADVVVIDKPAGLVVHPSAGHADQTLVNALLFHVRDLSGVGGELRPGIVHRLDKDTSGVMIIAKSDDAHRRLTDVWGSDKVRKEYYALIYGTPAKAKGTIDAPIGRDPHDRKRMAIVRNGRAAITDYEVTEQYRYISLVWCSLRTGRTHQIRVHLKHLGHPIVGDPVYSGPQWRNIPDKKLQRAVADFERQALHAARLTFPHPRTGESIVVEAPMPEDMARVLAQLKESG
jgi:23S rRNA pseudouridine1911/1915/1917 synthase